MAIATGAAKRSVGAVAVVCFGKFIRYVGAIPSLIIYDNTRSGHWSADRSSQPQYQDLCVSSSFFVRFVKLMLI